jgi:ribosomal protein L11 methyltransferase
MSEYIQIKFQNISSEQSDILLAQLSSIGFEGFEEGETSLKAFILSNEFDEILLKEITSAQNLSFNQSTIKETNWNAVWESNFDPVIVEDFVGIRADFHEPIEGMEYEIVITPKMSFGTGHHATTYMMIQQMRDIEFKDKTVFDFGTGTGVLAILAEKLGAENIFAVDNDEWSITNTAENLERNSCAKVKLSRADNAKGSSQYNIILANINKNVILDNMNALVSQLKQGGTLLFSGLLEEDEAYILNAVKTYPLKFINKTSRNSWIALRFVH